MLRAIVSTRHTTSTLFSPWRCHRFFAAAVLPSTILPSSLEGVLVDARAYLASVPAVLDAVDASKEDRLLASDARRQLDELFLVVVVGEFNSGKSTTINALLGKKLLADGVTPTTSQISVIKYGEEGKDYR
jgi:ribosome biogenesis GTPase A